MISGLPVAEDQNEILSFQEYHWQNEFGPKFSAVQLAITDIDLLTEDGNFGINHYLKLKEKINEIILGVLVFFVSEYFALKVMLAIFLIFQKIKDLESDEIYLRFYLYPRYSRFCIFTYKIL